MKLKKYLTLTRAGIMETFQFRLSFIVMIIGNLLYLIVMYFVWSAIYASSNNDIINGLAFTDTLIYLVLAPAQFNLMEMYIVWEIGNNIQSGRIVLDLLKPIEYRKYIFWLFSGGVVSHFLMTFLPTFIAVAIATHGAISMGINLLYYLLSVVMAISINFSIEFIVGTICLYTESIWGINIMKQVIVLLLSGATIPIAFFPEPLKAIINYLPFQSIYNAPLSLLLDGTPAAETVLSTLGTQLIWCIIMMVISKLFWKVSLRQVTVNGG